MRRNRRKAQYPVPEHLIDAREEQEIIAQTADKERIDAKTYKGHEREAGENVYHVRNRLREIYHNKCAYCESKEFKPEVEHYRPKKKVTAVRNHPGYYWLCYEWTNLLPSCRYCNTEGGKGNKFPISGTRASSPPLLANGHLDFNLCTLDSNPLTSEMPLLLNPELDTPEDCFSFDNRGKMRGIDRGGRGKATIEICDLNRDNLKYRRQKAIDDLKDEIIDAFALFFDSHRSITNLRKRLKQIFESFEHQLDEQQEFSLLSTYCFNNFDDLVIPLMVTTTQRNFLSQIFNTYRQGNL